MNIIARLKGLYRRLFGRTRPTPTIPTNPMKANTQQAFFRKQTEPIRTFGTFSGVKPINWGRH
jgi:hypothetical protein